MHTALTPGVARDLGRTFRFLRTGRNMTLNDLAKRTGLSIGYIANIEVGDKTNPSEEQLLKLARGLNVPMEAIRHLIFRARVFSALELAGITPDTAMFVWRGIEQRLRERDFILQTDVSKLIADMLENGRDK